MTFYAVYRRKVKLLCVSDLQKIMAESRDYDELLFAWKGWRNSAGKILRQDYKRYVELANKAATLNGMTFKEHFFIQHNTLPVMSF